MLWNTRAALGQFMLADRSYAEELADWREHSGAAYIGRVVICRAAGRRCRTRSCTQYGRSIHGQAAALSGSSHWRSGCVRTSRRQAGSLWGRQEHYRAAYAGRVVICGGAGSGCFVVVLRRRQLGGTKQDVLELGEQPLQHHSTTPICQRASKKGIGRTGAIDSPCNTAAPQTPVTGYLQGSPLKLQGQERLTGPAASEHCTHRLQGTMCLNLESSPCNTGAPI